MKFCRINLSNTQYQILPNAKIISVVGRHRYIGQLKEIYTNYCRYKKFESVMPLFDTVIFDPYVDVIGYHQNDELIAFSLVKKYDSYNVESLQFAWDYKQPNLKLGIASIKHECAYYKHHSYKYLYLGLADKYKEQFDGYEILGPA